LFDADDFQSRAAAAAVGHVAKLAASTNVTPGLPIFAPGERFAVALRVLLASSVVVVVGQPAASAATAAKSGPCERIASLMAPSCDRTPLFASELVVVGHPVEPVSDVRSADARSRKRDRPEGVTQGFQVILYEIGPAIGSLARNLLSKQDWRAALADEVLPRRPEVPLVIEPSAFTCLAVRLARATSCPDASSIVPSGSSKSVGPHADAGEEVALGVALNFIRRDVFNAAFIYVTICD